MKEITLEELERELSETYIDPEIYLGVFTPYLWVDFIIQEKPIYEHTWGGKSIFEDVLDDIFRWYVGHPILHYPLTGINKIKKTLGIEGKILWAGCVH